MDIRKANGKDWPEILRLIQMYPDTLVQDDLPRINEFFVAVENGKIVGCAALEVYSRRMAEVRSVAVDRDFQKKGTGAALIDACVRDAEEREIRQVLAITGRPEVFEKKGFGAFKGEKLALLRAIKNKDA